MAREVGGTDLGRVLRTLSTFLREDARTRAELETRQGWVVHGRAAGGRRAVGGAAAAGHPVDDARRPTTRRPARRCWSSAARVCFVAYRLMLRIGRLPAGRAGAAVSAGGDRACCSGSCAAAGLILVAAATRRRSGRCGWSTGSRPTCTTPRRRRGCSAPRPSRACSPRPAGVFGPVVGDGARLVDRVLGGRAAVRRRLDALAADTDRRGVPGRAGGVGRRSACSAPRSLDDGRARSLAGSVNVLSAGLLCVAGVVGGVLGRDWWLTQQVQRREELLLAEFPVVAELLALAVTAGESPVGARSPGSPGSPAASWPRELGAALGRARAGVPLTRRCSSWPTAPRSTRSPGSSTACSSRSSAAPRWPRCCARRPPTSARPASAGCSRPAAARRSPMMVPVVFLVLPVTVLFPKGSHRGALVPSWPRRPLQLDGRKPRRLALSSDAASRSLPIVQGDAITSSSDCGRACCPATTDARAAAV